MKKWLKRAGVGLAVIVLLFSVFTYMRFSQWRNEITKNLTRDSTVVQTAKGPIEYAEVGQGPPVLMVHGDPGGYDQIFEVLKLDDAEHGDFRYIIPSRPGYLRTPLSVGKSPKEQAEAFAALLDVLKIDKVAVVGGSGGGPSAIEFAALYPDRCSALVLEEAITMRRAPGKPGVVEAALKNTLGTDFSVWLIKDQFAAGLQAQNPADPKLTSIAMAIFDATIPDASRDAGHQNDIAEQANISALPLEDIRCPTLILQGTADVNVPIAHGEFAHAHIAGSQFVRLAEQDHWMVITRHRELGKLIHAFLVEHAGAEK
jgi:pimeloyl-ACP methyl ester carboxylesterase